MSNSIGKVGPLLSVANNSFKELISLKSGTCLRKFVGGGNASPISGHLVAAQFALLLVRLDREQTKPDVGSHTVSANSGRTANRVKVDFAFSEEVRKGLGTGSAAEEESGSGFVETLENSLGRIFDLAANGLHKKRILF